MKLYSKFLCLIVAMLAVGSTGLKAQDKLTTSMSADLVSSYYWRGMSQGGPAVQPEIDLGYKNFTFSAWGNIGLRKDDVLEIDLTLGYQWKGLSLALIDYWTKSNENSDFFRFNANDTEHTLGGMIGYEFNRFSLNWYTNFNKAGGLTKSGKNAFSSYIEFTMPFEYKGINWELKMGAIPWGTDYYAEWSEKGFTFNELLIKASKDIELSKNFSLPISTTLALNPHTGDAFFIFGISL